MKYRPPVADRSMISDLTTITTVRPQHPVEILTKDDTGSDTEGIVATPAIFTELSPVISIGKGNLSIWG